MDVAIATNFCWFYPQKCVGIAGRRQPVVQPGRLTLAFAMLLVSPSFVSYCLPPTPSGVLEVYAGIRRIPTSGVFLTACTHLVDHK